MTETDNEQENSVIAQMRVTSVVMDITNGQDIKANPVSYDKYLQGDSLPSGNPPRVYRYYCESPSDPMVKDIFFNMEVKSLVLSKNPNRGNDLRAFNIRADFSYFYGDEGRPGVIGNNHYKRYEWEGNIFCAKHADEEQLQVVEEYNQCHGGKSSVVIDERLGGQELDNELHNLYFVIESTNNADRIKNLALTTLDSLRLRSYESERRARRHRYNRRSIYNRYYQDANRGIRGEVSVGKEEEEFIFRN